ncbi:MAG TPA: helix-turn-helix transcriptional regulator [Thermoanaerobaculia bacterium]|jgi:transcriptional regulator with XRE-family HTH domain|nr:helix-turn-helix transcriptional regulator [Thermoanaerobaculia bacterium]
MTSQDDELLTPEPDIDPQDEARYRAEEQRLLAFVAKLAKSRGASIRSLEAKAGVGLSVFSKVLSGKVAPSVRHLLRMCDAIGVSWAELYRLAYMGEDEMTVSPEFRDQVVVVLKQQGLLPVKPAPPAKR